MADKPKSKKEDPLAWFKFDVGAFLSDTRGLSLLEVGLYSNLQATYWAGRCKFKDPLDILKRKVGVVTSEDSVAFERVLKELFTQDGDGNYRHEILNARLAQIVNYSAIQAERGSKGGKANSQNNFHQQNSTDDSDDDQF